MENKRDGSNTMEIFKFLLELNQKVTLNLAKRWRDRNMDRQTDRQTERTTVRRTDIRTFFCFSLLRLNCMWENKLFGNACTSSTNYMDPWQKGPIKKA